MAVDEKRHRVLLRDIGNSRTYEAKLPAVIGRAKDADIRLSDPSVSRHHALLEPYTDSTWLVTDLGSANGVLVDGLRIKDHHEAGPGAIITLGNSRLEILEPSQQESTETVILRSLPIEEKWHLDARRLRVIYDIAVSMSERKDVADLMEDLFKSLSMMIDYDKGYIVTVDEDGALKVAFPHGIKGLPLSSSIARQVLVTGDSLLLQDALSDEGFSAKASIIALQTHSAMAAPLRYRGRVFGLIYLERGTRGAFNQEDMELLRAVAHISGPILENAKLRQALEMRYQETLSHLKEAESRLIDMERLAALALLAQAIAHEIRNPVMIAGGLLSKLKNIEDVGDSKKIKIALDAIRGIGNVLQEVDSFVRMAPPSMALCDVGRVLAGCLEAMKPDLAKGGYTCSLSTEGGPYFIELDEGSFGKAISLIVKEIIKRQPEDKTIPIVLKEGAGSIDIVFGIEEMGTLFVHPFTRDILTTPWRFGLYLTMAYKIIADHGGRILVDSTGHGILPLKIELQAALRQFGSVM